MAKLKIEIKNRWTGKVLFEWESENNTVKETLLKAIEAGSNLIGSDLRGSNLSGSNLRDSDLRGSDLRDSDLSGSDLRGSDLRDSDLRGSDLRDSDLSGSDLRGSDLRGSNLRGSDLRGSNLIGSDLYTIKNDFFEILLKSQPEIAGLRQAIVDGKINGSTYEGECACLVGTIANVRGCGFNSITGIIPNSSRPAEKWFLNLQKGVTPENSQVAKITVEWIDEFLTYVKQ